MRFRKGNVLVLVVGGLALIFTMGMGYILIQNQTLKNQKASTTQIQETPANNLKVLTLPKPDDVTTNWNIYEDKTYQFSLKYPDKWQKGTLNTSVVVLTPEPKELIGKQIQAVYIQVVQNQKVVSSSQYFEQSIKPSQSGSVCTHFSSNQNVPPSLKNKEVTIIEGLCGVLNQGPRMFIAKDNFVVDISSSFPDTIDRDLIYQILSTFKFTN